MSSEREGEGRQGGGVKFNLYNLLVTISKNRIQG